MTTTTELSTDRHIGRTVHGLLYDRDMRQRALADHMGIDETKLSRLLRGKQSWSVDDVISAAAALGVGVSDLLPVWAPRGSNPQPTGLRPGLQWWSRRRKRVLYANPRNHPALLGFPQPRQAVA